MNKISKRHGVNLKPGTVIQGKWHNNIYTIVRKIGEGAVGSVFLCHSRGEYVALKISKQNESMTIEVNVLKSLQKVQDHQLGPYLLDVDDWHSPGGMRFSFYVMEFVQGQPMVQFIQRNGTEWIGVFLLQLLDQLHKLHQIGWVFGDLKLDNLIVQHRPVQVRFVDVGGTTKIGRSIKEYTEFYDRGYWNLGSRKAEPSYDLFALAMVCLHIFYPNEFPKRQDRGKTIIRKLDSIRALKAYQLPLQKAILGKYRTSQQMKQDIIQTLQEQQRKTSARSQLSMRDKRSFYIESGIIFILAVCFYLLSYIF